MTPNTAKREPYRFPPTPDDFEDAHLIVIHGDREETFYDTVGAEDYILQKGQPDKIYESMEFGEGYIENKDKDIKVVIENGRCQILEKEHDE